MNFWRAFPIRPLAGSGAITLSLLWLLGVLNADVPIAADQQVDARTMIIEGIASDSPSDTRNEPEPPADSTPAMEFSLELPTLDLKLDAPDMDLNFASPVVLSIAPMPATRPNSSTATGPSKSQSASTQLPRESHANKRPRYPSREKELRIEGSVYVLLLIDETGRVTDLKFVDGPESFRQSVSEVAWDWKFTPAIRDGRPVKVWAPKRVRFDPANES